MKNKKFEEHVMKIIKKYSKVLLLDKYQIGLKAGVTDSKAIAQCQFRYPYLDNDILYSKGLVKMWEDKEDITPIIVHELCHIVTDPFYAKSLKRFITEDEILDEREALTDHLTNIINKNEYNSTK